MKRKTFTGLQENLREFATKPELFIAIGLAYLIISTIAMFDPVLQGLSSDLSFSVLSFGVFLFGLLSFYIGIRTGKHALKLSYIPILIAVLFAIVLSYHVLNLSLVLSVLLSLGTLLITYILLFSRIRWIHLFAIGALLVWLGYLINGIPILDMQTHGDLYTVISPLFMAGFVFMLYSLVRIHPDKRYLWIFAILSISLTTYRLYVGIAFITWMILELKEKKGSTSNIMKISAVLVVAAIMIITGQMIMTGGGGEWQLDALRTLEYRLAFTLDVFDDIVRLSFPFGYSYGESLTMESTEYICRTLYGYEGRVTATTFGESMLNFGLIGVFLMSWWVGAVLVNLRKKDYRLYAMMAAVVIATLDVGINVLVLIGLTYFGWLRVIKECK